MANKMWIKAMICQMLMERDIHYASLVSFLVNHPTYPPSCQKDIVVVLAEMYLEKHIMSQGGIVKWNPGHITCMMKMDELCEMIAEYATIKWDTLP